MRVVAKVELNLKAIQTLIEGSKEALKDTASGIIDDLAASQTVPYRTGKLELTAGLEYSDLENGHAAVTFDTPYARRIYFNPDNRQIHQTYNSNAQSMWMQTYIDGGKSELPRELFTEAWKKYCDGVIK